MGRIGADIAVEIKLLEFRTVVSFALLILQTFCT